MVIHELPKLEAHTKTCPERGDSQIRTSNPFHFIA